MVDFLEASPLRYALTVKPTVYISHLRQFWSTAKIETTEEGTKILVTVDGIVRTVSKSSLRRNLKLRDEEGISSLSDAELFENLTLMRYNISPNQNNIATALICLATNRTYNFSKMIFDGLVKNVNNKAQTPSHTTHPSSSLLPITTTSIPTVTPTETTPIRQYTRRTRIVQSSVPLTVADEPTSPQSDASQGEACPTDSDFIAGQDRETIDKSSTLPHDSAPWVTSPAAVEGNMQQTIPELTALCTSLQRQLSELTDKFQAHEVEINRLKEIVKQLEEREGVAAINFGDDAPIKGRSMERVSDDTKEMATVLTLMDSTTVLESGVVDVPTGSRSIPTASTPPEGSVPTGSDEVPTTSLVFATATVVTPVTRRKGKEVMVESETPKKQKVQEQIDAQVSRELEVQLEKEDQRRAEQIDRDAEIARIHAEEELQSMIDGLDSNNKTSQQRKSWNKKQKRDYYMDVIRNNLGWKVKDFSGMTFEEVEAKFNSVCKQIEDFIPMGSKEEAERIRRKGINLEQESAKKQKSSEEITKEAKSPEEVPEKKVKEMTNLVLIEEVYVEDLQVKHPIINWKVELNRMYEPDKEDQLWTHTQNFMHAPVEWKLYDSCRVHHVAAKDKEIFMLMEKDYPLRNGLALVMICYKLQVKNFLQMENELVLKIYRIANSPRQQVIKFPLAEEVPTASVKGCHCQKKSEATAKKI
nr:hypothetical protein [Tanacetum cinerariifolium]